MKTDSTLKTVRHIICVEPDQFFGSHLMHEIGFIAVSHICLMGGSHPCTGPTEERSHGWPIGSHCTQLGQVCGNVTYYYVKSKEEGEAIKLASAELVLKKI